MDQTSSGAGVLTLDTSAPLVLAVLPPPPPPPGHAREVLKRKLLPPAPIEFSTARELDFFANEKKKTVTAMTTATNTPKVKKEDDLIIQVIIIHQLILKYILFCEF